MRNRFYTPMLLVMVASSLYSQTGSINNTLGTGGLFSIKDGSATFMSLSQSDGYLGLNKSLTLPVTTGSTLGVIYKGADRFIHDFKPPGAYGYNTFVGVNSGNFTMSGPSSSNASYNTAVGHSSLTSLTTGSVNSAFGSSSLLSNTTGFYNSAFGASSLHYNTTGQANSAFGHSSLYYNTTGYYNSAFGTYSLNSNTTGVYNSGFGYISLYGNTTGQANSAVGSFSLYSNTTGYENAAVGHKALYSNTTGSQNTSLGDSSLYANSTGFQNTAVGHHALAANTGNYNTALGFNAGSTITTGSNLTCIGIDAAPSSPTATDQVTLGNVYVSSLRCNVTTITALSDARDKRNIKDLTLGLDFLMSVKPRFFYWDRREWYDDGKSDGSKMQTNPTAGFIAQELDDAQTKEHAEWLNLVLKSNPDRLEATPGNLLPIIVKAIQELKTQNDALKNELVVLRDSISEEVEQQVKEKVKEEVRKLLLRAAQTEESTQKVSLNESKD